MDIDPKDMAMVDQYCKSITVCRVSFLQRVKNVINTFGKKLPILVSSNYSKSFHNKIKADCEKINPDIVYCQLIRMAPYCSHLKATKVLDYMDAYGIGMERRAVISSAIMKLVYNIESKRTKAFEKEIYKKFKGHTVISKQDRDLMNVGKTDIVTNGIDHQYFTPYDRMKDFDLGFVGNMGYLPNVGAVMNLCKDILPTYASLYKYDLSLLIAGARPHQNVKKLASDKIKISGWVDDIRDAYARCKILCAPIYNGTGQQNKILEAMSMGIPCITTSDVNAAIGATHNEQILIANNKVEFAKAIHRLLTDPDLHRKISTNCRAFILKEYSWDNSINKLNTIFAS